MRALITQSATSASFPGSFMMVPGKAHTAHLQMHAGKACSCSVPALTGFITLEALSGHWNLHTTAVL